MWIFLEGVDRSGKSTVADMYRKRGYEVIHMSAPNKKYTQPGYTGPSYLDETLDLYIKYSNKDVVFDRTPYGEAVWPFVYGRPPLLLEDDFEILREMEDNNQTERLVFFDEDEAAHWKRCVDNKEPLTKNQFKQAGLLFERMGTKYDFRRVQLKDFQEGADSEASSGSTRDLLSEGDVSANVGEAPKHKAELLAKSEKSREQQKLETANAINDVLSKRIIKGKGEVFDQIEKEVRSFLNDRLSSLFGADNMQTALSVEEIQILKLYVKQLKKKLNQ